MDLWVWVTNGNRLISGEISPSFCKRTPSGVRFFYVVCNERFAKFGEELTACCFVLPDFLGEKSKTSEKFGENVKNVKYLTFFLWFSGWNHQLLCV